MGREAMEAQRVVGGLQGGVERVGAMDPAAIDDHHALCAGGADSRPHVMEIRAQLLGITVGHDFREDFRGALLHRPDDAEPHPAGEATPGALRHPRLAFQRLLTFALTLRQRTGREARAGLCATSPHGAGQNATGSFRLHRAQGSRLGVRGLPGQRGRSSPRRGRPGWDRVGREGGRRSTHFFEDPTHAFPTQREASLTG
jgi:hypothetical protein